MPWVPRVLQFARKVERQVVPLYFLRDSDYKALVRLDTRGVVR